MNRNGCRNALRAIAALAVWGACAAVAGPTNQELPWIQMKNGRLVYGTDAERNRIPDFRPRVMKKETRRFRMCR
jgi:hypothetical protein